jgi:hypothetical protein
VPSHLYELSFAPNPHWSRRYAPQAEIQAYLEDVARDHGVMQRIRTSTEVQQARWDGERRKWVLQTSAGPHEADVLLTACGQLSVRQCRRSPVSTASRARPSTPRAGAMTSELAGRRVAVGRDRLQRDPGRARHPADRGARRRLPALARLDDPEDGLRLLAARAAALRRAPALQRADRAAIFAFMELGTAALTSSHWLRRPFRTVANRQITKAIDDPELRAQGDPADEVGCKRIMLTDDWYPTLTQPNVDLVVDRIAEVTANGDPYAGRRRATGRRARAGHRLQSHAFVAPMKVVGAGGRTPGRGVADVARAYPG